MKSPSNTSTRPARPRRHLLGALLLGLVPRARAGVPVEPAPDDGVAADCHVEIRIELAEPTRTQPGQTLVTGSITRVYQGDLARFLRVERRVRLWIDTRYHGKGARTDDVSRIEVEALRPGRYLETRIVCAVASLAGLALLHVAAHQSAVFPDSSPSPRR